MKTDKRKKNGNVTHTGLPTMKQIAGASLQTSVAGEVQSQWGVLL